MSIYKHVGILFILILGGCATYTPSSAPVPDLKSAPMRATKAELVLAADPYGDVKRQQKYFDADLSENGVIAIHLGVTNAGPREMLVRLDDIVLHMPNQTNISPITASSAASQVGGDGGVVGATIAFGLIGYLASASAHQEAQTARRADYKNKAFKDARLKYGQTSHGFVYFVPSPGTAPFEQAELSVRFVDVEQGTSESLKVGLNQIGYTGKTEGEEGASVPSSEPTPPVTQGSARQRGSVATTAGACPPDSVINFHQDRSAIEAAISDYWSTNYREIFNFNSTTMRDSTCGQITVRINFEGDFGNWSGTTSRKRTVILSKKDHAFRFVSCPDCSS